MKKKLLSVLLTACLVLTLLPALQFPAKAGGEEYAKTYQELTAMMANSRVTYINVLPGTDFGWPTAATTLTIDKTVCVCGNWTIPSNMTIVFNNDVTSASESGADRTINVQGTVTTKYNNTADANFVIADGGTLNTQKIANSVTVQDGGTLNTINTTSYLEVFGKATLTLNKTSKLNANGIRLCGTLAGNDAELTCSVYPASTTSDTNVDPIISGTMTFTTAYKGIQCDGSAVTIPAGSTITLAGGSIIGVNGSASGSAQLKLNGTLKVQRTTTGGVGVDQYGSIVLGPDGVLDMSAPSSITQGYDNETQKSSQAETCVTGTGTLKATNYYESKWSVSIYGKVAVETNCPYVGSGVHVQVLKKHSAPAVAPQTAAYVRTLSTKGNTLDLGSLLPSDRGTTTYTVTNTSNALLSVSVSGDVLTYGTAAKDAACTDTVTVVAHMAEYADATITLTVKLNDPVSGASFTGSTVTANITCSDPTNMTAVCAVYDVDGRMLGLYTAALNKGENDESFTVSQTAASRAKVFVLKGMSSPQYESTSIQRTESEG
jgi:hypothetical protein